MSYLLIKHCFPKVCIPGRVGENRSKHCPDGFYGQKCKMKCPLECNKTCDKAAGFCPGYSSGNITIFV